MTKKCSIIFMLVLMIVMGFGITVIQAKDFELSWGSTQPVNHPEHQTYVNFKNRVEELTDGHIKITIYPNNQLGNDRELLESIQTGTVDLMRSVLADSIAKGYAILSLPFLFKDTEHYLQIANSDKFKALVEPVMENNGIIILNDGWCGGRDLYAKRPVHNLDDLEGLKIRTIGIPVIMDTWKALGAISTPVAWTELFNALQTDIVDAGEGSPLSYLANKFYEAGADNLTVLNMQTVPIPLLMSKSKWDQLPAEYQQIIKTAAEEWSKDTVVSNSFDTTYQQLEEKGVTIFYPEDKELWKEKVIGVQDKLAKELGPEYVELLEWIRSMN